MPLATLDPHIMDRGSILESYLQSSNNQDYNRGLKYGGSTIERYPSRREAAATIDPSQNAYFSHS
jgi:hypothetical protein